MEHAEAEGDAVVSVAEAVEIVDSTMHPHGYRWCREHRPHLVRALAHVTNAEQWLAVCGEMDLAHWAAEEVAWQF